MKKLITVVIFCFVTSLGFAQTQGEMHTMEVENYKTADKELNLVYIKILNEYKAKPQFIKNLKLAQNLWIKFRDAELNAKFPAKNKQASYGSSFAMCWDAYATTLTKQRTETLKVWLNGVEEGDVCSGSVKIN